MLPQRTGTGGANVVKQMTQKRRMEDNRTGAVIVMTMFIPSFVFGHDY